MEENLPYPAPHSFVIPISVGQWVFFKVFFYIKTNKNAGSSTVEAAFSLTDVVYDL